MSNARDKANIPALNFSSTGIDDNATSTAITIDSSERVGIGTASPTYSLEVIGATASQTAKFKGRTVNIDGASASDSPRLNLSLDGNDKVSFMLNRVTEDLSISNLTANDIIFYNNSSERMRLNSTGLGVGTSAPSVKLDVRANSFTPDNTNTSLLVEAPAVFSQAQHFYINNAGSYNSSRPSGGIGAINSSNVISLSAGSICTGNPGADGFKAYSTVSSLYDIGGGEHNFKTKSGLTVGDQFTHSTRMTIKSDGKVGINKSVPNAKLHVDDSGGANVLITRTSTNQGIYFETDGTNATVRSTSPTGSLLFQTNSNNERMRIDSSGNVGIGTTTLTYALNISESTGNMRIKTTDGQNVANASTSILEYHGTDNRAGYVGFVGGDMVIHTDTYSAGDIKLQTNGSERMRIDSSGNVLVGTTTAPNIAGAIHVANSSGHGLQITNTSASKNRRIYMGSSGRLYFWNGTNEGYLSDAGAWTNASDERLKNNIRNIEYGLNTVLSTKPRHYERNDVEGTYIGFVAQELQNIIPEVVSGNPDKQLGIDYGSLVAVSFKAIQEQQTIIQELEARITALETNQP